ncbi:MAG TPA: hypothetical protein VH540_00510 [Ktedonobacterales bacterium]|jgi:hypothetical protein
MDSTTTVTQLYERIPLEAMQQVADSYIAWYVQKVTQDLDAKIAALRSELEQNDKEEAQLKPSAAELDAMRRLQNNNVTTIELLDRLMGKGEEWLVLTMHRLDYFERAGLAPHDYPGWCEHALGGAYDWIDAGRLHASKRMFSLQGGGTGPMRAVRPSDLASVTTGKSEAVAAPRPEPATAPRPAPQPQRTEPPAPKTAAARMREVEEPSTQPVPSIPVPPPFAQEHPSRFETAPLPPPPPAPTPRAEAPRQAPAMQPPSGPLSEMPTRPGPAYEASAPTPRSGALPGSGAVPPAAARSGSVAPAAPMPQPPAGPPPVVQARRTEPPAQPTARPQPQPPLAPPAAPQSGGLAAQPVPQRPRPATWTEVPEQRPDPRFSLDDVEIDEMDEEGEQQGFLRKIFRVFTQEN